MREPNASEKERERERARTQKTVYISFMNFAFRDNSVSDIELDDICELFSTRTICSHLYKCSPLLGLRCMCLSVKCKFNLFIHLLRPSSCRLFMRGNFQMCIDSHFSAKTKYQIRSVFSIQINGSHHIINVTSSATTQILESTLQ